MRLSRSGSAMPPLSNLLHLVEHFRINDRRVGLNENLKEDYIDTMSE